MTACRTTIMLSLLCCCFLLHMCSAHQRRRRALFPSIRIKRGLATMLNPTFHNSIGDINLLFEVLLSGLQIGEDTGSFSVSDAELASLRQTRKLEAICEDVLPRKLTAVRRLSADLSHHAGPLRQGDFERTLLTMVYTAQRVANSTAGHQRDVWAESFVSLYKAIKQDLTGTF